MPESLDNLRVQSGNSSEYIQANRKHYKTYVDKRETVENLHHEPECDQYLCEKNRK
jgi:hypothetical protein